MDRYCARPSGGCTGREPRPRRGPMGPSTGPSSRGSEPRTRSSIAPRKPCSSRSDPPSAGTSPSRNAMWHDSMPTRHARVTSCWSSRLFQVHVMSKTDPWGCGGSCATGRRDHPPRSLRPCRAPGTTTRRCPPGAPRHQDGNRRHVEGRHGSRQACDLGGQGLAVPASLWAARDRSFPGS